MSSRLALRSRLSQTALALALLAMAPGATQVQADPTTSVHAASSRAKEVPRIEVAFVLDATGSMGPYIDEARATIKEIAAELSAGDPAPEVKFALIRFRDRGDKFVTQVEPFSSDIEVIKGHLDKTQAQGGGDGPEAVLEGLHEALDKLKWSSSDDRVVKMAYLVGDAEAKHYKDGPTEKGVAALARKKGVVIHTIGCGHSFRNSESSPAAQTWSYLARLTEGRSMRLSRARASVREDALASGDFASVVGGTSKAYSSSVGVRYDESSGPSYSPTAMTAPGTTPDFQSGLLGAQVRWVRDPLSWSDLWTAHVSMLPADKRPPLPAIDFSSSQVLVVGSAEQGLSVESVRGPAGKRSAQITPLSAGGVSFLLVPTPKKVEGKE